MKHSIKKKITLIFAALFSLLVLIMLVFYSFFLLKYYRREKIKQLCTAYETVDNAIIETQNNGDNLLSILKDDYDRNAQDSEAISMLRNLSERSNIDIIMMNSTGTMAAATSRESEWNLMKLKAYISFNEVFGDNADPFYPIFGDLREHEKDDSDAYGDTDDSVASDENAGSDKGKGINNSDASSDNSEGSYGEDISGDTASDEDSADSNAEAGVNKNKKKHSGEILPSIEVLKKTDSYTLQLFNDRRSNTSYLECWGQFSDNDTYFLMTMPIASMEEGVGISKVFLIAVSLAVLIIGAVAVYVITGIITKPIINLAEISEKVSKLDFSARYTGRQNDEIGVLGDSMNQMSDRLEETIRELKEANARLQEDIDAKTRIDEMRKEFIADVSHELKTPIAIIEGYAEGLVEGIAEDKETRDYYSSIIMDEAGKMNKLVKQLTSLISYEFGDNENVINCFDMSELVRSVLEAQKMRLEEAGAAVETDLQEKALIDADEFKIEEVFTNYLNNAINHLEGEKKIRVRIAPEGEYWKLSVYNDGTPIPEESIAKLWDKFYKVDKSRSRQYGGSGIGLSIVKAIVESHNGKYGVENHEHGVEFWACLKRAEDTDASMNAQAISEQETNLPE